MLALSVCAFAAENIDKLFVLNAASGAPASEAAAYAEENGFDGILLDCRSGCSESYMTELFSAAGGKRLFALCHADFSATLAAQNFEYVLVPAGEATEETLAALGEKAGLFLPFGGDEALEKAGELYSAGGFTVIFAENFHSSYSETNYEAYLKKLKKSFPDAKLYTVNDLSRVLTPVSRGDFFGDAYELNNQYLVNVLRKTGFCVYDYAALKSDANGSASYLVNAFGSTVLDKYADFSISKKFAITRPATSALTVETYKYTIFGTSDPGKKLYMDGVEIKRIGTSGLFAVTVDAPKKGATYPITQGDAVRSVTINRGTATGGSGKPSRLSSIAPAASLSARPGEAVTITCLGPAGGAVSAQVAGNGQSDSENGGSTNYKDGTYTGEADGFGGTIQVEVKIEKSKIAEINVISAEKEDGAYLSMAKDIIPKIIDAQSADIDTISGATFSSTGIKNASEQALEKAVK